MINKNQDKLFKVENNVKQWRLTCGKKRQWPDELKLEIIMLVREGFTITDVSRVTGIRTGTIYKWSRQSKQTKIFKKLAVTPKAESFINTVAEISIETTRGHLVKLPFSALNDLFKVGAL